MRMEADEKLPRTGCQTYLVAPLGALRTYARIPNLRQPCEPTRLRPPLGIYRYDALTLPSLIVLFHSLHSTWTPEHIGRHPTQGLMDSPRQKTLHAMLPYTDCRLLRVTTTLRPLRTTRSFFPLRTLKVLLPL